jgi:cell division protein FtsB
MPYKKIAFLSILFFFFITINNLAHSIYDIWQKQELIKTAQKNLDAEKKENQNLNQQIAQAHQSTFIEAEARDKLYLTKSGEKIVYIPTEQIRTTVSQKPQKQETRQNWKQWFDLFFGS